MVWEFYFVANIAPLLRGKKKQQRTSLVFWAAFQEVKLLSARYFVLFFFCVCVCVCPCICKFSQETQNLANILFVRVACVHII